MSHVSAILLQQGRDQFGTGPLYQAYFKGKVADFLDRQIKTEIRVFEDAPSESAILKTQGARPKCLRGGRARARAAGNVTSNNQNPTNVGEKIHTTSMSSQCILCIAEVH